MSHQWNNQDNNLAWRLFFGTFRLAYRVTFKPFVDWHRRHSAINQLREMSDRLLADMGICRNEIELAVDGKLHRTAQPIPFRRARARTPDRTEMLREAPLLELRRAA